MPFYLGIDTSNYTTSLAVYDSDKKNVSHSKKLLPVQAGSLGLKQSDAVFSHVKQLPQVAEELFFGFHPPIKAVGVSVRPRNQEDSYMPCFLVGKMAADVYASVNGIPVHEFSHQHGHIAAALYSCNHLELLCQPFIAFHFSGGTTECVHVTPNREELFSCEIFSQSMDLKCGQAIDRVGKMLGCSFPAGKELDELSLLSRKNWKIQPTFRNGNCCISGLENQCAKLLESGESKEDIARYCIEYVCAVTMQMAEMAQKQFPGLPMIFSGGVMSNTVIRERLSIQFGGYFAAPEFSSDNAAGVAVLSAIKEGIHVG